MNAEEFALLSPAERKKERARQAALKAYYSNKELHKARHQKWVEANKDYIRDKQREKSRERKLKSIEYLGGCCKECGGTFHPAVFEFHHLNPEEKEGDPSKMLQWSWERLRAELDKCVLLCANCHRLTHHKDKFQ